LRLLTVKVGTVVDKCSPATPIDHAGAGAARPGAAEGLFPSVMPFNAAQRARAGDSPLRQADIHLSPHFDTEWLESG
jgi:hypothetical protein